jgi:hypothetical protein
VHQNHPSFDGDATPLNHLHMTLLTQIHVLKYLLISPHIYISIDAANAIM